MIDVTWDEKRCGYWITGDGFDFFSYFTSDSDIDEDIGQEFIECDHIKRDGDPYVLHLQVPLKTVSGVKGIQIVETQIVNELQKYWHIA